MATSPQQKGFHAEDLIQAGLDAIGLVNIRERAIREFLEDPTINGVDHWVSWPRPRAASATSDMDTSVAQKTIHVFAQTKWSNSVTQPDVAQFVTCVDRIVSRFASRVDADFCRLWVTKSPPTAFAAKLFEEYKIVCVQNSASIADLAIDAVAKIAAIVRVDPALAAPAIRNADRSIARV